MKKIKLTVVALLIQQATLMGDSIIDIEYLPSSGKYEGGIGIGGYQINSDVGLYGNFQGTITTREPMYESLTVNSFNDPIVKRYNDISILNIGASKKFFDNLAGYIGIGYAQSDGITQKYDPSHILGSNGAYYVKEPSRDEKAVNINGGILLFSNNGKLTLNIGRNSFTGGNYFGLGIRF